VSELDYKALTYGLNNLASACYANAKAHGFTEYGDMLRSGAFEFTDTDKLMYEGNLLMLVVGELSEAHEQLRHGRQMTERYYSEGSKPEGAPSELADVIIRVLDICGAYGIDIEAVVAEKMRYNAGRPFLHNKKF